MTRRTWIGFATLCLLAGSGWVYDQATPSLLQGLTRFAVHDGLLGLAFWLASLRHPRQPVPWVKLAAGAAAIFAIPQVLFAAAGGKVSSLDEVLVFLLVPVVVVLIVAQRTSTFGAGDNPLRLLAPALAGLGGAALLLEFDAPATLPGKLWLAAMVVSAIVAAFAAVQMHGWLRGVPVLRAAAIACAATSFIAAAFCLVDWTGLPGFDAHLAEAEMLRCVVFEAPVLLLTIWLLRRMSPIRFSSRLLLIPLVTIVEGFFFMRPALSWTAGLGLILMLAGAVGLLRE
jgi:drug/metabolite transporter (DMT)-like permease